MDRITIDCAALATPEQLHGVLARELAFPDHYGRNLDALYDCLTALSGDTELILSGLGQHPKGFARVFRDAAQANPRLRLQIVEKRPSGEEDTE